MMKVPRTLIWLVFALILAMVLFSSLHPRLANSDLWERQRVAAEIQAAGQPPSMLPIYGEAQPYLYPPLFDLLMAALLLLTGLPYVQVLGWLGILAMIPFLVLTYLVAREFLDEKVALLAPFAAFTIPRLFRIAFQPLPEFLGITALLLALLLAMRKKYLWAGAVLGMLALLHLRATFNALLIIGIYLLIAYRKDIRHFLFSVVPKVYLIPAATLIGFYVLLPGTLGLQSIENPFVVSWPIVGVLGPMLLIAALALFKLPSTEKNRFLFFLLGIYMVIYLAALALGKPLFAFREILYAFIPVSVLGAYGLHFTREQYGYLPFALLVIVVTGSALYINAGISDPISIAEQDAIVFAAAHTEQSALAGGFIANYAIPALTDKKIIAGAFLEGVRDAQERINDLHKILDTSDATAAAYVMQKYHADTVVLTRAELQQWYPVEVSTRQFDGPHFKKIYANEDSEVYQLME